MRIPHYSTLPMIMKWWKHKLIFWKLSSIWMEILNDIAYNLNQIEFNEHKFLNVIQIQLNWTQIYKLNSTQYSSPLKVNFFIEILIEFNLVQLDSFHNLIKYNSTKLRSFNFLKCPHGCFPIYIHVGVGWWRDWSS